MTRESGKDYRINKIERGPLQRFKNQNLLLKKFGEIGLQVYKVITGKRTTEELRKDLDIEQEAFAAILGYMEEAGMVELLPVSETKENEETAEKTGENDESEKKKEDETEIDELKPIEDTEEENAPEEEERKELSINPITEEESEEKTGENEESNEKKREEEETEIEELKPIEDTEEETTETKGKKEQNEELEAENDIDLDRIEPETIEHKFEEPKEEISPVEKIIKDKYGEVGIKVYTLIDGQRTAEEIMKETGLSEKSLVEILDFMDDQGIIKFEYGGSKDKKSEETTEETPKTAQVLPPDAAETGVEPKGFPTIDIPVKASLDVVRLVQLKAKILLKLGDKGNKVFEEINGKNDVVDISIKTDIPLYNVLKSLSFLMEMHAIIMKPLIRLDVKKKYGDDGFTIYKRYGREGVMLFELINKNLTIKQMAERTSTDKRKVVEMFLFIHKVLNIDIPIDEDVLMRQLGI